MRKRIDRRRRFPFISSLSILTPADTSGSSQSSGTHYWYGEHEIEEGSNYWPDGLAAFEDWTGGLGACSTDDFVDWKYEGIMLHYANVSDMVLGREPEGGMVLQQPKVTWARGEDGIVCVGLNGVYR